MNSRNILSIIEKMTLEQKASLCSGRDRWNLKGIEELDIPSIMVSDGPHGLRKQIGDAQQIGLRQSAPATCFPTASTLASTWDCELLKEVGAALAGECRQEKVAVILGPGANIKRSPLCGRNFEYFSEDPYLTGKLAAAHIQGVQSQGIGASLKHFVANNQERRRMVIDVLVDDRALRELYLAGFEEAVKAQPETVMCAYNRLNGEYCSENSFLLTKVLKEEWGHKGLVVTDWGATNERVKGLQAGLELEMPGSRGLNDQKIVEAVRQGQLSEATLNAAVERLLNLMFKTSAVLQQDFHYDADAHHALARRVEAEGAVLLKNNAMLPLKKTGSLAVIGRFAKEPRYQGNGSSLINPGRLDNAWDALVNYRGEADLFYADGYDPRSDVTDRELIAEACKAAGRAEQVIIFAGLPDIAESEGFDREDLFMPENQNILIKEIAKVNPKIVVVLSNGAPVTMPWLDRVAAVLETYLGGQAWGTAVVDLLFGESNPCGKLAETFPESLHDLPSSTQFPGGNKSVAYTESLYLGYRYFDSAGRKPLFPFGHGLSYTSFEYSNLQVGRPDPSGTVQLSFSR